MGRKKIITIRKVCSTPTDTEDELCSIINFKYPQRLDAIVARFEAYLGLPLTWSNISVSNLVKFKTFLLQDVATNSAATICAWLASAIRIYCEDHKESADRYCSILNVRREKGIFASVKLEEMLLLESYYRETSDLTEKAVSSLAILEFYTGARNSDTDGFTSGNITSGTYIDKNTGETKTRLVISYSSEKTNIKANIPVKPIVQEILENNYINDCIVTNEKFNRIIKVIFRKLNLDRNVFEHRAGRDFHDRKLYEAVTSHSFRRSFATELNDKGVNIEMISRMMGHTNTQQTRGYICGQNLVLDEKAMEFFN